MPFISLKVHTQEDFSLNDRLLVFERGTNVYNLVVKGDVDELLHEIRSAGGTVVSCDRLDEFEPLDENSHKLLGE